MTEKLDALKNIDPLLFHTKRLIILSLLIAIGPLTQGNLRKKGQLTWGTLTAHLKQLERVGYIQQKDVISIYGPRVLVNITEKGLKTYNNTLLQLKEFISTINRDSD
ncbi:transcriptional regulator [Candidatus Hodarchaeum mangrovi]